MVRWHLHPATNGGHVTHISWHFAPALWAYCLALALPSLQSPEAAGRGVLLSSSQAYTQLELAQMLALDFADWPLPVKAQGLPEPCPAVNTAGSEQLLKLQLSPISSAVVDMAKGIVKVGIAKRPEWYVPPVNALLFAALYKAFNKALGGGFAGAVAMIIQVGPLQCPLAGQAAASLVGWFSDCSPEHSPEHHALSAQTPHIVRRPIPVPLNPQLPA